MASTPVCDDGYSRPFKSTCQQFNRNNIKLTTVSLSQQPTATSPIDEQTLSTTKIRYTDITARVVGFETFQLPVNQYGRSLLSPIQSPQQHDNYNNNTSPQQQPPPETAIFYKIQITAHYILEFLGSYKGNGSTHSVNSIHKYYVDFYVYRRFREFYDLYSALDTYYQTIQSNNFPPKEKLSFLTKKYNKNNNDSGDNSYDNTIQQQQFNLFNKKRQLQLSTWLQSILINTPAILHSEDINNFLCLSDNLVLDHYDFPRRLFKSNNQFSAYGITDFYMCKQYYTIPKKNHQNNDKTNSSWNNDNTQRNNINMIYLTSQDSNLTTKLDSKVNNLFTSNSSLYGCLIPLLYTSNQLNGCIDIEYPTQTTNLDTFCQDNNNNLDESNFTLVSNNNNNNDNDNDDDKHQQQQNQPIFTNDLKLIPPASYQPPYFSSRASCIEVLNNKRISYDQTTQKFILSQQDGHKMNNNNDENGEQIILTNTIFVGLDNGHINVFQHEFTVNTDDYCNINTNKSLLTENTISMKQITTFTYHTNRVERLSLAVLPITNEAALKLSNPSRSDDIIDNNDYNNDTDNNNFEHVDNKEYLLTLISSSRDGNVIINDLFNGKLYNIFDNLLSVTIKGHHPYGEIAHHYFYPNKSILYITTFSGYILQYNILYNVKEDTINIITLHGVNYYTDCVRKIVLFDQLFSFKQYFSAYSYGLICVNNYQNNQIDIWDFEHKTKSLIPMIIGKQQQQQQEEESQYQQQHHKQQYQQYQNDGSNNNNNNNNNHQESSNNHHHDDKDESYYSCYPKLLFSLKLLKPQCKVMMTVPLYLSEVLSQQNNNKSLGYEPQQHQQYQQQQQYHQNDNNNNIDTTTNHQNKQQQQQHQTSLYYLFTGHANGCLGITIVNLYNCKYSFLYAIDAHEGEITQIKYNSERNMIITSSSDKTIAGWNIPNVLQYIERIL